MLEIQARCELLRLAVQLVYTSKPEVYVTHKNSTTTTPHKLLLPYYEAQPVNSVDRNNPVYCESHVELIDTLCEQNAEFLILYRVVHIVTTLV